MLIRRGCPRYGEHQTPYVTDVVAVDRSWDVVVVCCEHDCLQLLFPGLASELPSGAIIDSVISSAISPRPLF